MAILDHETKIKLNYSPDDTYEALKHCRKHLPNFVVEKISPTIKTIYYKAKASLFSWGENITVSVNSMPDGTSEVSVLSTPKTGIMFGGAADMGKNRKNIEAVLSALSKELNNYNMINASPVQSNNSVDIADQIKKLADLKEQGILTPEEFDEKKKRLLDKI